MFVGVALLSVTSYLIITTPPFPPAQSTFSIGEVGPRRNTPDYYALRVMNEMRGVLFQSRLNHNIREVKGYSYGVNSNFAYGKGPGAFRAGGDIVTAKSDAALVELCHALLCLNEFVYVD